MQGGPKLTVYQLPLDQYSKALREWIPLFWADNPDEEVDLDLGRPLAYEEATGRIWVYDLRCHRLLRVVIPNDIQGKFLVDAVIGQSNKTERY